MTIITDSKTFIQTEFSGLTLGDQRLNTRIINVASTINASPGSSLPKLSNGHDSQLKAIYRFFQNEKINDSNIMTTHYENTVARMNAYAGKILLLNDSCFVTPAKGMEGLLTRGKGKDNCVRTHYCLAVSEDGVHIFGLLDYFCYHGKIQHDEIKDESDLWLLVAKNSINRINQFNGLIERCLYLGDREADDFALMSFLTENDLGMIIRSQYNREIMFDEEQGRLFDYLSLAKIHGASYTIKTKKDDTLKEVEVQRSVLRNLTIFPPSGEKKDNVPLELSMVHVEEINPDDKPVSWRLWTTEPINNSSQSASVVDSYSHRWKIEEVNKGTKTGVKVEQRQFTDLDHFLPFLAMAFVIGWRIVALRNAVDVNPDEKLTNGFNNDEIAYLEAEGRKNKIPMETIKDALYFIARLGGFTGRYPRPGWQILWQGWMTFYPRVEGFILAKSSYG